MVQIGREQFDAPELSEIRRIIAGELASPLALRDGPSRISQGQSKHSRAVRPRLRTLSSEFKQPAAPGDFKDVIFRTDARAPKGPRVIRLSDEFSKFTDKFTDKGWLASADKFKVAFEDMRLREQAKVVFAGKLRAAGSQAAGAASTLIPGPLMDVASGATQGAALGPIGIAAGVTIAGAGVIVQRMMRRQMEELEAVSHARGAIGLRDAFMEGGLTKNVGRKMALAKGLLYGIASGKAQSFEVDPIGTITDLVRQIGPPGKQKPIVDFIGTAEDILSWLGVGPDVSKERREREEDIAKWRNLPNNMHPVVIKRINDMQTNLDAQLENGVDLSGIYSRKKPAVTGP